MVTFVGIFPLGINNKVILQWSSKGQSHNSTWTFPTSFTTTNYMALGGVWWDTWGSTHLTKTVSACTVWTEEKIMEFTSGSFVIGY